MNERLGCGVIIATGVILGWLVVGAILFAKFLLALTPDHLEPVVGILMVVAVILWLLNGG